jgi:putative transposase
MMSRKARVRSKSGLYHIMSRGANRQEIFHDDEDCQRYLDIIKKYKMKSELRIYAWCLMNNHVHLVVKEGNEDISLTMKRIGVSYANYYNWKYQTIGHLFQDRFRSENVETDQYLLKVIRYNHQNPVKAGIVQQVVDWRWSSCRSYYYPNPESWDLVDTKFILNMFSSDSTKARELFKEFNERSNHDQCLDDRVPKRRVTDDEARQVIKTLLGEVELTQVKSLPGLERNEIIRKIKGIEGISHRQAARILGVAASFVFRA